MAEPASPETDELHYRIRREATGFLARLRVNWREKRWFRHFAIDRPRPG